MNKYELLDVELAKLLGWENITETEFMSPHSLQGTMNGDFGFVPRWTQDDGECFRLMVAHNVSVLYMITHVKVSAFGSEMIVYEDFKNHKDNQTCLRFAVVQAIITRLKET